MHTFNFVSARSKGDHFIEAPVSGSKKPAEDGQLVILFAGDKALYDEALPAFDVLGKKSFFLGEVGNGAKMKLVVNMIMGSMMNAFSEGLTLAGKSGLSPQTVLDVLDLGAIANAMFKMKGPTMIQNNYPPAFPLKHQQKDMRLALALGDENAVSMPVAAAANEVDFLLVSHVPHIKYNQKHGYHLRLFNMICNKLERWLKIEAYLYELT
ncbi:Glyoxylate/succinic semialdehyde reductase [Quillaja saponaria]|uniref:Glyoxylate/succinic semialdehyde reductase n=1 Tax=Quillaja saponaria TaxID=32244 RepID=A0AAD7LP66_QUISA|nr:Glyoxylate/succinic semialdehyde reductase [Quillaja saponaria]